MKQRLTKLLLGIVGLSLTTPAKAYDFESGGLYYNILSKNTVEVTYKEKVDDGVECFYYNNAEGDITIPSKVIHEGKKYTVTAIGEFAFGYSDVQKIFIPNTIATIGKCALDGCSLLELQANNKYYSIIDGVLYDKKVTKLIFSPREKTSVTIPNSVTTIGEGALACSNLQSIIIPESVTTIEEQAFWGCFELTAVTLPNTLTTIGEKAFFGCYELKNVTIPNSVTSIGANTFNECYNLGSVTLGNGITKIEDNLFFNSAVTSIVIPHGVVSIGNCAFAYCSWLTSVTIPESVTTIEESAFESVGLTIYCKAKTPPVVNVRLGVYNAKLYVPAGCKKAYKMATGWSEFDYIEEMPVAKE